MISLISDNLGINCMEKNAKIYVAGHAGLVGSAIIRRLSADGYTNLLTKSHRELDLTRQREVEAFFDQEKPEYVFLAAAKVGGILANSTYPADFIYTNLMIQNNVIHNAYKFGTRRLLFLGSSCIYPRLAPQPMREEHLLTGLLEPTNEPYAIAKIAGIKMCESYNRQYGTAFIPVMPTNLYGPNDNFDLETSHVIPALIRKFSEAKEARSKEVIVWGTGNPRREFLHVDDLANACLFVMQRDDKAELINIGTGKDITIRELAEMIGDIVGFRGKITWDSTKPDGTPLKLLDTSKIKELGWEPRINLREGLMKTYEWYVRKIYSH